MAYFTLEPWGKEWEQTGTIAAAAANPWRKTATDAWHYIPLRKPPEPETEAEAEQTQSLPDLVALFSAAGHQIRYATRPTIPTAAPASP